MVVRSVLKVSRSVSDGKKNGSSYRLRTPKRPFAYAQTTVCVCPNGLTPYPLSRARLCRPIGAIYLHRHIAGATPLPVVKRPLGAFISSLVGTPKGSSEYRQG